MRGMQIYYLLMLTRITVQITFGRTTRRKAIELGREKSETETEVTSLQTSRRRLLFSWASSSRLLQVGYICQSINQSISVW